MNRDHRTVVPIHVLGNIISKLSGELSPVLGNEYLYVMRRLTYNLSRAVDRTAIQSLRLVGCVLYLQAGFDMLNRCSNETDRPPCHDTSDAMADSGQLSRSVFDGWDIHMKTRRGQSRNVRMKEEVFV